MASSGVRALDPASLVGAQPLNKQKHITYWKRCLKTYLPQQYTSTDSNRMLLAFFIVSALDLLGALQDATSEQEREGYVQWIYRCQHPEGGFRGFPGTDFGHKSTAENRVWDPANVPATYMALATLLILGDDLSRVKRRECLAWLRKLQRQAGSFGETLGEGGSIEGGFDSRFGYCAVVTRWVLRGAVQGDLDGVPDIDVERLVESVRSAQAYDGGVSEAAFHEAHGGFTYCSLGILSFLRRLPPEVHGSGPIPNPGAPGIDRFDDLVQWLLLRQTDILYEDDLPGKSDDAGVAAAEAGDAEANQDNYDDTTFNAAASGALATFDQQYAGFNGRCNKHADTCYCFWIEGSLCMVNRSHLSDVEACRRYLLSKTAHLVGGFGKGPGDPPDIYHSYLGLAALALLRDRSVKPIMAAACFSQDAVRHLVGLRWRKDITGDEDVGLPQGFIFD